LTRKREPQAESRRIRIIDSGSIYVARVGASQHACAVKARSIRSYALISALAGVLVGAAALVSCDGAWCNPNCGASTGGAGEGSGGFGGISLDGNAGFEGGENTTDSGSTAEPSLEAGPGATAFSASGNWTVQTKVSQVIIEAWGGGGGGGSAEASPSGSCISGGGGGQAAYARALLAVAAGDTLEITVGGAGAAATQSCIAGAVAPTAATAGGNSEVALGGSTIVTARGGQAGEGPSGGDPGRGGSGGSGIFSAPAVGLAAVTGHTGLDGVSDTTGGAGGGSGDTAGAGGGGGAYVTGLPANGVAGLVLVTPVN
jgi:hypothetical protein